MYFLFIHENRRVKPAEIVPRGEDKEGE
jgi:hypothetical protein